MPFREESKWNELNELRCLLIFKKLESEGFQHGKQIEYCRKIEAISNLSAENLSAKVCNYKSLAGVNKPSNASTESKEAFKKYGKMSLSEFENVVAEIESGV